MHTLVLKPGFRPGYLREITFAAISLAATTVIASAIVSGTGYVTVALLYLLLVVFAGLNFNRWTVLFIGASCALLWNFLFIPPRFTFYIATVQDLLHFAMFFVVALAMGHLTSRLRANQILDLQKERRARVLYELVRQAGLAIDRDSGLCAAVTLIETLFASNVALLLRQSDHTLSSKPRQAGSLQIDDTALRTAQRLFSECRPTDNYVPTIPETDTLYFPLLASTAIMGVLILKPSPNKRLDNASKELLQTLAVLIGSILERDHLLAALKHAEILEASERLHHVILQSVSHELKTPLAAIRAGFDALAEGRLAENKKQVTLEEVQSALGRLQRVIDNLLNMSRIESGSVKPRLDWCDVGELVEAAIGLAKDNLKEHHVNTDLENGLPMVKMDQPLLEQVLCNLLLNAAFSSPLGSEIIVAAHIDNNCLELSVEDQGKGLSQTEIGRIFEAFYRGKDAPPGGGGLGLAIVDGFVRAHGGSVRAMNREPCGAKFVAMIPVETFQGELLEEPA